MAVIHLDSHQQPIDDIGVVRHRLQFLSGLRLLSPFSSLEQEEYDRLCRYERQLMGRS